MPAPSMRLLRSRPRGDARVRPPTEGDAAAVAALGNAFDTVLSGEDEWTEADVHDEWRELRELGRDAWWSSAAARWRGTRGCATAARASSRPTATSTRSLRPRYWGHAGRPHRGPRPGACGHHRRAAGRRPKTPSCMRMAAPGRCSRVREHARRPRRVAAAGLGLALLRNVFGLFLGSRRAPGRPGRRFRQPDRRPAALRTGRHERRPAGGHVREALAVVTPRR
jgi:hypothetical protein